MPGKSFTTAMRELLIEHIDGRRVPVRAREQNRQHIVEAALKRHWLRVVDGCAKRPKATIITEAGRGALSDALADWADALTRAQRR